MGQLINVALDAADQLEQQGISVRVLKLNSIRPLDIGPIQQAALETRHLLVAEECGSPGCAGHQIAAKLLETGMVPNTLTLVNLGEQFVPMARWTSCGNCAGSMRRPLCKRRGRCWAVAKSD